MTLKDNLLRAGYLPENIPPAFHTDGIADFFRKNPSDYLSNTRPVKSAVYNASKRGLSRRNFSAVHPVTAHDLAQFLDTKSNELAVFFAKGSFSLSVPRQTPDGDRAIEIASYSELEEKRFATLSGYRVIAKTDVSRFYHSIYTHSIPWAIHGKALAKKDRKIESVDVFCNRLDFALRQGQDGQTIGIPVDPDASRFVAEVISTAIDLEFERRCGVRDLAIIRHVDDIWIGAQSHADAEQALWRYREAIREFELDINEAKTYIFAEGFHFADVWPSEISNQIDLAMNSTTSRRSDRLRAALEFAFASSINKNDDGILKYAIRHLDRAETDWDTWPVVQPFLMRCAAHFGHTTDYVSRMIVWRYLVEGDLDKVRWETIIRSTLNRNGRLVNDSEVCWSLFAALHLGVFVPTEVAVNIIGNCGALSILALLHCIEAQLVDRSLFDDAIKVASEDDSNGPMWPLYLEWASNEWPQHNVIKKLIKNTVIDNMRQEKVRIFDSSRLPRVFKGIEKADFTKVTRAIESNISLYEGRDEAEKEF